VIELCPVPWNLTGKGFIILYKFSNDNLKHISNYLNPGPGFEFKNGLGCIMLVDYNTSNVGPYKELLFIPGKFAINGEKKYSITKIYVSENDSVINGRKNWAIPKELADFKFEQEDKSITHVKITHENNLFLDAKIKEFGLRFPVSTSLLPFPLCQYQDEMLYYTKFLGVGKGRLASIDFSYINNDLFPDVTNIRPLMAISVDDFKITFPEAKIISR
jgi:hypothetical protein